MSDAPSLPGRGAAGRMCLAGVVGRQRRQAAAVARAQQASWRCCNDKLERVVVPERHPGPKSRGRSLPTAGRLSVAPGPQGALRRAALARPPPSSHPGAGCAAPAPRDPTTQTPKRNLPTMTKRPKSTGSAVMSVIALFQGPGAEREWPPLPPPTPSPQRVRCGTAMACHGMLHKLVSWPSLTFHCNSSAKIVIHDVLRGASRASTCRQLH